MPTFGTPIPVMLAIAGAVALWQRTADARTPLPPLCPAARYLLPTPLLVAGQSTPVGDALVAGNTGVAIDGLCEAAAPRRFKATRKGTSVKVVWPGCPGLRGKVRLQGLLADGCATFKGKLRMRRFTRRIRGTRSACGDGRVDRGGGEACDPPLATGCDSECRIAATATIGPAGARLTSLDGLLTLEVPDGALSADSPITIRRLEPGELPPDATQIGAERAYRLGPDGLDFSVPVRVTFQHDAPPLAADGRRASADTAFLFSVSNGRALEFLRRNRTNLDGAGNAALTSSELDHFSEVASSKFATADVEVRQQQVPVGANFIARVKYTLADKALNEASSVQHEDKTPADVIQYLGEKEGGAGAGDPFDPAACSSGVVDPDRSNRIGDVKQTGSMVEGFFCYVCRKAGSQSLAGEITIKDPAGRLGALLDFDLEGVLEGAFLDDLTLSYEAPVIECVPASTTTTLATPGITTSTSSTTSSSIATSTTSSSTTTTTLQPRCAVSAFPECGGSCPDGQSCTRLRRPDPIDPGEPDFDFCGCVPAGQPCTPGVCGECPPDRVCRAADPVFDCSDASCVPIIAPPTTSSTSTTSTTTSTSTSSTTTTTFAPCRLDDTQSPRMCNGDCPQGFACLWDGDECNCRLAGARCRDDLSCLTGVALCESPDLECRVGDQGAPDCDCLPRLPTTIPGASSTTTTTTSTTTTTLAPQCGLGAFPDCGGSCPDGQRCTRLRRPDPIDPGEPDFDFCGCVPAGQPCTPGVCGECPPDRVCRAADPVFDCSDASCVPIITPTSTSSTSTSTSTSTTTSTLRPCRLDGTQSPRMCGGDCGRGFVCLWDLDGCDCFPEGTQCKDGACIGFCASPDLECRPGDQGPEDCDCLPRLPTTIPGASSTTTTTTSSTTSTAPTTTATSSTTSTTGLDTCGGTLDTNVYPPRCVGCRAFACLFDPVAGKCVCPTGPQFCQRRGDGSACSGLCPGPDGYQCICIVTPSGGRGARCDHADEFQGRGSGADEVPPTSSPRVIDCFAVIDPGVPQVTVECSHSVPSGEIVAAHMHMGAPGVDGEDGLTVGLGTSGSPLLDAVIDDTMIDPSALASLILAVRSGDAYVHLHTLEFPDGEIRAQLLP